MSDARFFVAKFSAAGQKEWQEIVRGTSDVGTSACATALAMDAGGNLFAAGTVGNSGTGADVVLAKIDGRAPRKHVLWTRRIDVLGFDDSVNAIALTPDAGVALAGMAGTASGGMNAYLMKINADGTDGWLAPQVIAGSAAGGFNMVNAVAVLPGGDLAIAGGVTNSGTNIDFLVGRFNGATGTPVWLLALNDSDANGSDSGTGVSVAPNGDIVAGGTVQRRFSGHDFAVFRFGGSGTLVWLSS